MKRLLSLLFLMLALQAGMLPVEQALAQTIPASIHLNQDVPVNGHFDSRYLENGSGIQVVWGTIPPQARTSGTPYTVNLRSLYLTEPGGSTIGVSGCSLPTGWSVTTDGLAYSGTGSGSATCQASATLNGVVHLSNGFQVSAGTADALAPSIPINLIGIPGPNQITWQWKPSTDQFDGTSPGSGLFNYDLKLNGGTPVVVADSAPGYTAALTTYNIGSISSPATPTAVISGGTWTLTSAGVGIDNSPDEFLLKGAAVTGDFAVSIRVTSITSNGNIYAPSGLMARVSSDPTERYVALYQWASAVTQGVQSKWRPTAAGAKVTGSSVAGSNSARWLWMVRQNANTPSETWSFWSSNDNVGFTQLGTSLNLQLPASLIVGFFTTSMQTGVANTAVFDHWSLTQRPDLSYIQSTTSASTGQVRARDAAVTPNVSAYNTLVSAAPNVVATSAKKWHPCWYVLSTDVMYGNSPGYQNSYITGLPSNACGWVQVVAWNAIESNTTPGQYDFKQLDTLLALAKSVGKRLVILVMDRSYSNGTTARLPSYLSTAGTGGQTCIWQKTGGVMNRLWDAPCRARYKALFAAIAAHWDTEPYFEGIETEESDTGAFGSPPDYTAGGYLSALEDIVDECAADFIKSNCFVKTNFLPAQSQMVSYVAYLATKPVALSSSDIKAGSSNGPANFSWGQHVLHGYVYTSGAWTTTGGHNYEAQIASNSDVEGPDMGGGTGHPTFAQLYSQIHTYELETHIFIERKMGLGSNCKATDGSNCGPQLYYDNSGVSTSIDGTGGRSSPDISTALGTSSYPLSTQCPSNYTHGCDTSALIEPEMFRFDAANDAQFRRAA